MENTQHAPTVVKYEGFRGRCDARLQVSADIGRIETAVATGLSQEGILVEYGASATACVRDRKIILPHPDEDSNMTMRRCWLDHEVGHIRFTDPEVGKPPGTLGTLVNVVEDHRIEVLQGDSYPGSAINLRVGREETVADMLRHPYLLSTMPVGSRTLMALEEVLHGGPIDEAVERWTDGLDTKDAATLDSMMDAASNIILEARGAASTQESLDYAKRIHDAWGELAEKQRQQEQAQQAKQASSQQDSKAQEGEASPSPNGKQEGQQESGPDKKQDGQDKAEAKPTDPGPPEKTNGTTQGSTQEAKPTQETQAGTETVQTPQELPKAAAVDNATESMELADSTQDRIKRDLNSSSNGRLGGDGQVELTPFKQASAKTVKMLSDTVNKMRHHERKLKRVLHTTASKIHVRQIRGRLDHRRFPALLTGTTEVFKLKRSKQNIDTAVCLLVDGSSSMRSDIEDAAATAASLALACGNAGCKVGVKLLRQTTTRRCTIHVLDYTKHRSRGDVARSAASMLTATAGGTPLGEAISECVASLRPVKAKRKILFAITDGCPSRSDGLDKAVKAVRNASRKGVECIGVFTGYMGGRAARQMACMFRRWTNYDGTDWGAKLYADAVKILSEQ